MFRSTTSSSLCAAIALAALCARTSAQTPLFYHFGSSTEGFGVAVDGGSDLDGDGVPDILAGGDASPANASGTARVHSGLTGRLLYRIQGSNGEHLGSSLSFVPDINGDGTDDFLVGAKAHNTNTGRVYLYSGRDGALVATLEGVASGEQFGSSLAGIGDLDGDGAGDFLVGRSAAGRVPVPKATLYSGARVWNGLPNPIIVEHFSPSSDPSSFGQTVAALGDVNGDGTPDYAIAAPFERVNLLAVGSMRVYSGASHAVLAVHFGNDHSDEFGGAIGGPGDVNGDGLADIVVGAPRKVGFSPPYVRVYLGRPITGPTGAPHHVLSEPSLGNSSHFGISVDLVPDLDGDGKDEIIVGSPHDFTTGHLAGTARIYAGGNATVLMTLTGDPGNSLGEAVSQLGDVNRDGIPDVLVGAPGDSGFPFPGVFNGTTRVYSGTPLTLPRAAITPFGTGCGSPTPALTATPPVLGGSFFFTVSNGPNAINVPGTVLFGLPLTTPFVLGSCTIYMDPSVHVPLPVLASFGRPANTSAVPLPVNHLLTNFPLAAQAFLITAAGLSATNAVTVQLGVDG